MGSGASQQNVNTWGWGTDWAQGGSGGYPNEKSVPSVEWGLKDSHPWVLMGIKGMLTASGYKQQNLNSFIQPSLT